MGNNVLLVFLEDYVMSDKLIEELKIYELRER